jgi:hypothetical protein
MPDAAKRRPLFPAIDQATGWVFGQITLNKTARSASTIRKTVTNKGNEVSHQPVGRSARLESGRQEFDQLGPAVGIEHRLTRPRPPQSTTLVQRVNGRREERLRRHPFVSGED